MVSEGSRSGAVSATAPVRSTCERLRSPSLLSARPLLRTQRPRRPQLSTICAPPLPSAPSASLRFSATGTSAADPAVGGDGDADGEGDASFEFGHPSSANEFAAVRSKMEQLSPASGSGSHSGQQSHVHVPLHFSHDYAVRPAHAYMTSDGPMA